MGSRSKSLNRRASSRDSTYLGPVPFTEKGTRPYLFLLCILGCLICKVILLTVPYRTSAKKALAFRQGMNRLRTRAVFRQPLSYSDLL